MFDFRSGAEWARLWRYYQAGIVNTLFGFGLYAGFVWLGANIYLAQICSHVLGVVFNYFTYSRYAFQSGGSVRNFVLSYALNYLLGLISLYLLSQVIASPYLAGLAVTIVVSLINYVVLKRYVFREVPVR